MVGAHQDHPETHAELAELVRGHLPAAVAVLRQHARTGASAAVRQEAAAILRQRGLEPSK
jgi:hypothetical protein